MQSRRAILASLPFLGMVAYAASSRNSQLLLCRLSLDRTVIRLDGMLKLGASLEARLDYVRIFSPLRWRNERGFHLETRGPDGKTSEPRWPSDSLPPAAVTRSLGNYRALDVGEQTGFSQTIKARDIFPAAGRYRLRAVYVPEPSRDAAPIQAIIFENGSVLSDTVAVTVI